MEIKREDKIKDIIIELSFYEKIDKDERAYNLEMKLGELYIMQGRVGDSQDCYEAAYNTAVHLKNAVFQIDALCKITEILFQKGDIDGCVRSSEKVTKLLEDCDYVEGKLENSLQLIKIYNAKNEHHRAREVGNEAIRSCEDRHLIYKGRIINALADVFSELISAEEHLELLFEALACFEEMNLLKGIMAVLNNIGYVYGDKLQDYEKALECYLKLKKLAEENCHKEAYAFACLNIGDNKFKRLEYEEAVHWYKSGAETAVEVNFPRLFFYAYVSLIDAYLKLYNLKEAFNYFTLAEAILERNSEQGPIINSYYLAVSNLMLEVGQLDKARKDIKQAMNLLGEQDTLLKWKIGLAYESIKLREAKNAFEITASLDSIKFILSKYKNQGEVLDCAYDTAIGLINSGHEELAFEFADYYKNIVCSNKSEAKRAYIEAARLQKNGDITIEDLNKCLEMVQEAKETRLLWRIHRHICEYYLQSEDFEKAKDSKLKADKCLKELVLSIPEKYRHDFMDFHSLAMYLDEMDWIQGAS